MIRQILQGIKQAVSEDDRLSDVFAYVLCAQGGQFPSGIPKPCLVISPDSESLAYANQVRDVNRTTLVTLYGYTEAYGEETGLFGIEGSDIRGVVEIGDALEELLMHNRLNGLVRDAKVLKKTFPIPPMQWNAGLNEVRVQVRYDLRTSWNRK